MTKAKSNIVSMDKARWSKANERKDDIVDAMAQRFEAALPSKATPVKDYLKKKRAKKKR
jgi:hypothetical protein